MQARNTKNSLTKTLQLYTLSASFVKRIISNSMAKKYLQIHGMVMDTEMAVAFAHIFLYGKKITDYLEAKYKKFCRAFEEREH